MSWIERISARSRRAHARTRGFTLIEVLAALVIVGLGMLAVIQAVSQTASNSTYLRENDRALGRAQQAHRDALAAHAAADRRNLR